MKNKNDQALTLELFRKSLNFSQDEIAHRSKMTQSEVSRIERREDWLLSTLTRYVEALGGKLILSVKLGGRCYEITRGPTHK